MQGYLIARPAFRAVAPLNAAAFAAAA